MIRESPFFRRKAAGLFRARYQGGGGHLQGHDVL